MRYRVLVVLASVVMLLPGVLAAQGEETWYFAWKPETGEVVAYTAAGEVNTILEDGVERSWGGLRMGPQTFIAMFESLNDGEVSLYGLTPESAQLLATSLFNSHDLSNPQTRPDRFVAVANPYAVLSLNDDPFERGLLINVDTGQVDSLDLRTWLNCCRFSKDRKTLRYTAANESGEGVTVTLRERTLATGEERIVHTIIDNEEPYPYLDPDLYGERWLYNEYVEDNDNRIHSVTMLFVDGTSEIVAEEEYYYQRDSHEWEFVGNNLTVLSNALCESDCSLKMYMPGAETPVDFKLPPLWFDGTIGGITLLPQVTDESILIIRGLYEYWLLKPAQDAEFIGESSTYTFGDEISHDGRWLLVTDEHDEPQEYRVWDNLSERVVLTGEIETHVPTAVPIELSYDDENVLAQSINTGAGKLYSSADNSTFELSGEPAGSYFEILADGTLLFQQSRDLDDRPSGIYLYDPTSESYTLLVRGASHFWLEPIFFF